VYKSLAGGSRNDATAMQYLVPGWKFDRKRPAFGRNSSILMKRNK